MSKQAVGMLVAAGLFLLGGCGGADDGTQVATANGAQTTTSAPNADQPLVDEPVVDEQDRMRQFAQCMREHGVDMPDPDPNAGGRAKIEVRGEVDKEKARAALEACRKFMPNGGERRELSPEDLEKMRQFAQCMREHGVDMPDPDPNGAGPGIMLDKADRNSEEFEQALEACRDFSPRFGAEK